ncbi:glycosyltransferase [Methylobacterium sp. Leaf456]|uniref:glycosyl transferase n=1 Tax=Methylobacterium sp. Leaf456 TaxID=1736382 RepID=UPI0006F8FD1E|nr:glycosyl transferase [Methylobacterium sp. Leaf456]KQT46521.1 glycosyltransferase [Methylobacterium sp. Leaf456]
MTRAIGYYVHHQGAGHWQRAVALTGALQAFGRPCTLMGTFSDIDTAGAPGPVLDLPDDRMTGAFDGRDGTASRPDALHYAPLDHAGVRARMGRIAAWAAETNPALLIVDVSCEVALFARLLSVPSLVVRLSGNRTDTPHLEAFRAASRLLAPFPEALDGGDVPDWVRDKTIFSGFLGAEPAPVQPEDGRIVVVFGRGGEGGEHARLCEAAAAVPDRDWHVLGPVSGSGPAPENLHLHGWVGDVRPHLAPAALVVGGAGDGLVTAVAAEGKRFLCLPEPRAYGEQEAKAEGLARLGAAVVHPGRPETGTWPALIAQALALDPARIRALAEPDAVHRTAGAIEALCRG